MLPCIWFSNRSQKTSKCGKNISDTLGYASCATFLFLPHFDVICDLLLNRCTATWNLFVTYTHKPLGVCLYQGNTSDKRNIPRLYQKKGLHNYFIPCRRKYSDQMGRMWHSWIALIDGKVWWNTDKYTMTFLHFDWLYFLWHGINTLYTRYALLTVMVNSHD